MLNIENVIVMKTTVLSYCGLAVIDLDGCIWNEILYVEWPFATAAIGGWILAARYYIEMGHLVYRECDS